MVLEEISAQQPRCEKKEIHMTIMTTIVAVALGIASIGQNGRVELVGPKEAKTISRYSETVDDTGTTHLRGVNRRTGEAFHITVNPFGRVEGSVGEKVVSFHVTPAR
jgi:hypothetical protein